MLPVPLPLPPRPHLSQQQQQSFLSHITMSMNLNITTSSSMNNSRPVVSIISTSKVPPPSSSSSNNSNNGLSPSSNVVGAQVMYDSSDLPPIAVAAQHGSGNVHSSGRKRKSSHAKKKETSKEKESVEKQHQQQAPTPSSAAVASSSSSSNARAKSPFEKLNTLKLLLDCGHLTNDEYQERKNQIINEMTGTSTERKKPSPRRVLQPIMKTVVPHNPPDFSRLLKERAEKLSFDVDTLEWHSTSTRVKLDLVPFATGQLRSAYYLQVSFTSASSMVGADYSVIANAVVCLVPLSFVTLGARRRRNRRKRDASAGREVQHPPRRAQLLFK